MWYRYKWIALYSSVIRDVWCYKRFTGVSACGLSCDVSVLSRESVCWCQMTHPFPVSMFHFVTQETHRLYISVLRNAGSIFYLKSSHHLKIRLVLDWLLLRRLFVEVCLLH
ncbi:unnamed protein product [Ixodes pacificus]